MNKIALIAEYNPTSETHIATNRALEHSAKHLDIPITAEWISTEDLTPQLFDKFQGIWVGTGSPYKNMSKTLSAIQFARENGVPTLATCGGFQHLIIELPGHRFFIGTLFVPQAQSTPERPHPLINGFISAVAEPQVL